MFAPKDLNERGRNAMLSISATFKVTYEHVCQYRDAKYPLFFVWKQKQVRNGWAQDQFFTIYKSVEEQELRNFFEEKGMRLNFSTSCLNFYCKNWL